MAAGWRCSAEAPRSGCIAGGGAARAGFGGVAGLDADAGNCFRAASWDRGSRSLDCDVSAALTSLAAPHGSVWGSQCRQRRERRSVVLRVTTYSDEEERWFEQIRPRVVDYVREQGLRHGRIGDIPAWFIDPYVSIWAVESERELGLVGWWADVMLAGEAESADVRRSTS